MAKPAWDHHDLDDLARLRDRKLRRQVRFQLYAYSPFYRRLFEEAGLKAEGFVGMVDLGKIPLVDRSQLVSAPGEFLLAPSKTLIQRWSSTSQLTSVVIDTLLRGLDYAGKEIDHRYSPVQSFTTAGTTGEAITVESSRRDLAASATQGQRMLEVAGVGPEDVVLNLLEYSPDYAFWVAWGGCVALGARQILPGLADVDEAVSLAKNLGVTAVVAEAEDALRFMQKAGHIDGLRVLIMGPRQVAPALRQRIQETAPSLKLVSTYGFAEARALWAECSEGAGYHSSPDLQIFEAGPDGEIAFTSLEQRGTALARYRPGDVAAGGVVLGPCPYCQRMVERVVGPLSRAANLLRLQFAGKDPLAVDVEELVRVVAHPGVISWQVEVTKTDHDPNGADELLVLFKPGTKADPARVAVELDASFRQELGFSPTQFVVSERGACRIVDQREPSRVE
ncbi:MAG: AMP-binding protein [Actinomycetota bacterium]